MSTNKVSLKLLIDTKTNRVLFAEAGKDFVDFLFSLMSLPIGTVVRLLTKQCMVGCLGNLYGSIESLSETYFKLNQSKDLLLNPKIQALIGQFTLPLEDHASKSKSTENYYTCSRGHHYITDSPGTICPSCQRYSPNEMSTLLTYVPSSIPKYPSPTEVGYVMDVVTYMVMDDLAVSPMSTISSVTMLNKFNIKEVSALEVKIVDLGMEEGLKLLEESLQSKTVLTNVFLEEKCSPIDVGVD